MRCLCPGGQTPDAGVHTEGHPGHRGVRPTEGHPRGAGVRLAWSVTHLHVPIVMVT